MEHTLLFGNNSLQVKVKTIRASRSVAVVCRPLSIQCYPYQETHQRPLVLGVQIPTLRLRNHRLWSRSLLSQDDWTSHSTFVLLLSEVHNLGSLQLCQMSLQHRHPFMALLKLPLIRDVLCLQPPHLRAKLVMDLLPQLILGLLVQELLTTLWEGTISLIQKEEQTLSPPSNHCGQPPPSNCQSSLDTPLPSPLSGFVPITLTAPVGFELATSSSAFPAYSAISETTITLHSSRHPSPQDNPSAAHGIAHRPSASRART